MSTIGTLLHVNGSTVRSIGVSFASLALEYATYSLFRVNGGVSLLQMVKAYAQTLLPA
jgi:hypothetical protein